MIIYFTLKASAIRYDAEFVENTEFNALPILEPFTQDPICLYCEAPILKFYIIYRDVSCQLKTRSRYSGNIQQGHLRRMMCKYFSYQ